MWGKSGRSDIHGAIEGLAEDIRVSRQGTEQAVRKAEERAEEAARGSAEVYAELQELRAAVDVQRLAPDASDIGDDPVLVCPRSLDELDSFVREIRGKVPFRFLAGGVVAVPKGLRSAIQQRGLPIVDSPQEDDAFLFPAAKHFGFEEELPHILTNLPKVSDTAGSDDR